MKKLTTLALLLTTTLQVFAGEIKITANLTGFTDTAVVYLLSGQTPIAYQTLAQGKVELTAEVSETPDTYAIYVVENNQPYYTMLFVANETIEITAAKDDFPYQVKVNGSKHHNIKAQLDELQMPIHKKGEALKQEITALQQTAEWLKIEVQEKYVGTNGLANQLTKELKQVEADFILNNFDNAYTWTLLPYNTTAFDKTFYKAVYNKMTTEQKQTALGKKYLLASQSQRLTKGDAFIDINLLDKDLKAEKLSDYFNKDKEYVLVDLSSVSCPSSRQAFEITQELTKNTEKLQVVSVLQSPDVATYQQFGAYSTNNWSIVYAEDFTRTDTYIQYQENVTPTFLLFDKSGKLIDRWTGAIHQQKLEQYLGK
ncbi:thioredoxin fold domain-containing protein [Paenimyroides viscosum]|uniref:DUF4369 domain-containing protein n=1 Tax=Paenimyroides viscosum TaxID=2488729 RepID=A0A3P1B291_9FLAO|nr:thioredoxin fold domain-containing protein [Paenimyroides viscosum]RRA95111.1 DUF4369 domain-containing protein [Paenimyroides viscosum]